MSCVRPLTAYRGAGGAIVFDVNKSLTRVPFRLPCGRCIGCRMKKAQEWGMRCMHEKRMHKHNCYVTLTYEDEFLPTGNTLVKRDLQLFLKRLRKRKGSGIRYFAGGEYGGRGGRPHYHLLLFNCHFEDMKYQTRNFRGDPIYSSAELRELWFQGFNTIGEVTLDSAIYCAKYCIKKVSGDPAMAHYEWVSDIDGVVYDRQPEFGTMSLKPGIGAGYYEKYGNEVRDHDSVIVNGRVTRPPRYYDVKSEGVDSDKFGEHKKRRKRLAVLNKADNTPERLAVKEELMTINYEKKEKRR